MPNNYFKFKHFTVYQNKSAMKVGTDGVLLGAWADIKGVNTVLDVGTGTGLIALMVNQRLAGKANIDAIDIDRDAIAQAKENIEKAEAGNITCIHGSFQSFANVAGGKYDLIVSNPPYFSSSLHSPDQQRTLARHTDSLSIADLVDISAGLLTNCGRIALVYPYSEKSYIIETGANAGLFASRITDVFPTPQSEPKRVLLEFSKKEKNTEYSELVIETKRHVYSDEYIALTKDFYLKM